jgi:hypothetical protein
VGGAGDVDPCVFHPQLTDYTHVLDSWGNALGVDVGTSCLYGSTTLRDSRAYLYCRQAWGPRRVSATRAPPPRPVPSRPARSALRRSPGVGSAEAHLRYDFVIS